MTIRSFDVDYQGEKKQVDMDDDIPWGDLEKILRNTVDISDVTKPKINMPEYRMSIALHVLKKAPFMINVEALRKVPRKTMAQIMKEVMKDYPLAISLGDWMMSFMGSANMSALVSEYTPTAQTSSDGPKKKPTNTEPSGSKGS